MRNKHKAWETFLSNHVRIGGHWYRKRPILDVLRRYFAAKEYRDRFFEMRWTPWFKEAAGIAYFWGTRKGKIVRCKEIHKVEPYSSIYGSTHTHHYDVVVDKDIPLICGMERLPKLAFDDRADVAKCAKDVLAGVKKRPLHRNDLVKRYHKMDAHLVHINAVVSGYWNLIDDYLCETYNEDRYKWTEPTIIIVDIPDLDRKLFILYSRSSGFQLLERIEHLKVS